MKVVAVVFFFVCLVEIVRVGQTQHISLNAKRKGWHQWRIDLAKEHVLVSC